MWHRSQSGSATKTGRADACTCIGRPATTTSVLLRVACGWKPRPWMVNRSRSSRTRTERTFVRPDPGAYNPVTSNLRILQSSALRSAGVQGRHGVGREVHEVEGVGGIHLQGVADDAVLLERRRRQVIFRREVR